MGTKALGGLALVTSIACDPGGVPACPGQCFEFTVERVAPIPCTNDEGTSYPIAFTGSEPEGYRGRFCFNATSVPLVVEAIEHRQAGGPLAELPAEVQSAYVSTVNAVRSDIEAECILAAPGQCTNADAVCSVLAADAYEQLVIDQSCVLALDGSEPVSLAPGQACEPLAVDQATDSNAPVDHCTETGSTTAAAGFDETSSTTEGADDTSGQTTGMLGPSNRRAR